MILLIDPVSELVGRLAEARPDQEVLHLTDLDAAQRALEERRIDAVVLGPSLTQDEALDAARKIHEQQPVVSVIMSTMVEGSTLYRLAMRAGVADVLPFKAELAEVREVLDRAIDESLRLRSRDATEDVPEVARTVATFATKGGCGKSFVATNLATMLAERYPGEVVLLDLDLQAGDAALMLQLSPERTLRDAAEYAEGLDDEMLRKLLTRAGDLQVLAAPPHPAHAEEVTPDAVVRTLSLLRTMFRWIVIDGPPSFTEQMLAALDLIDTVVVVSSLDVPSIKNLKLAVETLKELGVSRERMKIVLNRADSKVGLTVREVERSLGTTIDIELPSSREVPFAVNQGIAIVTARPKAPISKALREALQLFDRPAGSSDGRPGRTWVARARD